MMVLLMPGMMEFAFSDDGYNNSFLEAVVERGNFAYSVTYDQDTSIGELEVNVSRKANAIHVLSKLIIHNALARLFLDEYIVENRFSVENGQLLLIGGEVKGPDRSKILSSYLLDRENGVIQYSDRESISFPDGMKFDVLDFPIVMLSSNFESLAGTDVLIVGHDKASLYQFETPRAETIRLRGKQVDSIQVSRKKAGEENRHVHVWITNDSERVPLMIVSSKRGRDLVFELQDVPQ